MNSDKFTNLSRDLPYSATTSPCAWVLYTIVVDTVFLKCNLYDTVDILHVSQGGKIFIPSIVDILL